MKGIWSNFKMIFRKLSKCQRQNSGELSVEREKLNKAFKYELCQNCCDLGEKMSF